MRLSGIVMDGQRMVAAHVGGELAPLAPVEDFWADPTATMAEAGSVGRRLPLEHPRAAHLLPDSARVLCLGLNYRAHASEGRFETPDHPVIFGRWTASLVADGAPVPVPVDEVGLDWEGEVAAVVGRPLCRVDPDVARSAVLGYAPFNDLTARVTQKLTSQWTLGKNADSSGPMGDVVTIDETGDLRDGLRLQTTVNGETVQDGDTRDMIFELGDVLARISRTLTLRPGDVVVTGTPEGVGYVRRPAWLLSGGDTVTVTVHGVGSVTTPIVSQSL